MAIPDSLSNFTSGTLTGLVSGADHGAKANAINKLEARVIKEAPLNLAWPEYGVDTGNSAATNSAAIAAGVTALGSNGGEMLLPRGPINITTLSFDDTRNITLRGLGGRTSGAEPATKLISGTTGSGTIVSAKSSLGFRMKDLMLLYSSGSFTGYLVDLNHSAAASDSAYMSFEGCYFGGAGVRTASYLFHLNKTIIGRFRDCTFWGSLVAIRGRSTTTHYANSWTFDNCTFLGQVNSHVVNPGQAWSFNGCTFECLVTSGGVAAGAGACTYEAVGYRALGLGFRGCWFGDANTTGDWITFNGDGLVVEGCEIGAGDKGIRVAQDSACTGVVIKGNFFEQMGSGILIAGNGAAGSDVAPNGYSSVTTPIEVGGGQSLPAVASAATVTLPPNAEVVSITGTTNITSVTAGLPERRVTLVFAGVLTFTQGSNLKLNSAAGSFVTTAKDTITLVSDGTNWIEVNRSANAP